MENWAALAAVRFTDSEEEEEVDEGLLSEQQLDEGEDLWGLLDKVTGDTESEAEEPEPEPPEPESSSDGFEEEEEKEAEVSGVSEGGLGPSGNAARERLPRAGPVARGRASHKRLRDVGWLAADPLGKGFIAPPRVAPLPAPRLPTLPRWHATLSRGLLDGGRALCRQLWTNPATTRHRATRSAPLTAEPGAQLALDPRGEKSSTAQLWQQLTR